MGLLHLVYKSVELINIDSDLRKTIFIFSATFAPHFETIKQLNRYQNNKLNMYVCNIFLSLNVVIVSVKVNHKTGSPKVGLGAILISLMKSSMKPRCMLQRRSINMSQHINVYATARQKREGGGTFHA